MRRLHRRTKAWWNGSTLNRKRPYRQPTSRSLRVESLEDRCLPAVVATYHGEPPYPSIAFNPVLYNVHLETVYYGSAWKTNSSLYQNSQRLDSFFQYVTDSPYMDLRNSGPFLNSGSKFGIRRNSGGIREFGVIPDSF